MTGDCHVQFSESAGVRFPCATQLLFFTVIFSAFTQSFLNPLPDLSPILVRLCKGLIQTLSHCAIFGGYPQATEIVRSPFLKRIKKDVEETLNFTFFI